MSSKILRIVGGGGDDEWDGRTIEIRKMRERQT
jgi:hypothetical protein